jgi:hypothetical protein
MVGAFVAAAVSVLLVALGSGLGFASISPWSGAGISASSFTVLAAVWLIVVQWIASGFGGYITGRLRTKWVRTHTHEVFMRDTAHGFATWAVATVILALVAASATSSLVGSGAEAVGRVASGVVQTAGNSVSAGDAPRGAVTPYEVDRLFRPSGTDVASSNPSSATASSTSASIDPRVEASRILAQGLDGGLSAGDRTYLAGLIASRAGISEDEASRRVDLAMSRVEEAKTSLKQAADAARKSAAEASIFAALSMLIGAFIASAAAALGGRERDAHP